MGKGWAAQFHQFQGENPDARETTAVLQRSCRYWVFATRKMWGWGGEERERKIEEGRKGKERDRGWREDRGRKGEAKYC